MKWDTVLSGGMVVSETGVAVADIAIHGERIVAVRSGLANQAAPGTRIIDASGRYVIPGAIDAHVHFELPVGDLVSSDDFDSGTRAAAKGGVTTVIDFVTPCGDETLPEAFHRREALARGKCCIDYGFHACLTKGARHIKQMRRMLDLGVPTFKQFMIYARQGWQSDDARIFAALEEARRLGAMILLHAESSSVLDLLIDRYHTPSKIRKYGVRLHAMTRPDYIESEAIQRAITWSRATGGRLYIVHTSTGEGAELVGRARRQGVDVWSETCPQYLVLDDSVFGRKDGHLFATSPQVKKKKDQARLWDGLKHGEVSVVATDTCTFTRKQKALWKGDWTRLPMGMPGVETMVPLVFTVGVLTGRLTMPDLVTVCCVNPARLMGLYPQKGVLKPGSDADLAVIHPTKKFRVDWRKMETRCDWSPYQDRLLAGFAEHALSRGFQVVTNYQFTGRNGWGCYRPRRPMA